MFATRLVLRASSMGRQRTLGLFPLISLPFIANTINLGKFFEMPKSVKPAPPQQSSLAEMWGGKRKRTEGADTVKDKSLEKEDRKTIKGVYNSLQTPEPILNAIS